MDITQEAAPRLTTYWRCPTCHRIWPSTYIKQGGIRPTLKLAPSNCDICHLNAERITGNNVPETTNRPTDDPDPNSLQSDTLDAVDERQQSGESCHGATGIELMDGQGSPETSPLDDSQSELETDPYSDLPPLQSHLIESMEGFMSHEDVMHEAIVEVPPPFLPGSSGDLNNTSLLLAVQDELMSAYQGSALELLLHDLFVERHEELTPYPPLSETHGWVGLFDFTLE